MERIPQLETNATCKCPRVLFWESTQIAKLRAERGPDLPSRGSSSTTFANVWGLGFRLLSVSALKGV